MPGLGACEPAVPLALISNVSTRGPAVVVCDPVHSSDVPWLVHAPFDSTPGVTTGPKMGAPFSSSIVIRVIWMPGVVVAGASCWIERGSPGFGAGVTPTKGPTPRFDTYAVDAG